MSSRSVKLTAAIKSREASVVELRRQHNDLIDRLADDPDDAAVAGELAGVEAELARGVASINALELARDGAKEKETADRRAAAIAATAEQRRAVLAAVSARARQAARVDAAAAAFFAELARLKAVSDPIGEDAGSVLAAKHQGEVNAHMNAASYVRPQVGTGCFRGVAAHLVRQLAHEFGGLSDFIIFNNSLLASPHSPTFVGANVNAAKTLERWL